MDGRLKIKTFSGKIALTLHEGELQILEPQLGSDRVYRIRLAQLSHVLVAHSLPWVRIVLVALFLFMIGFWFLNVDEIPGQVILGLLFLGAFLLECLYVVRGKTTIQFSTIVQAPRKFTGMAPRRRLDQFLDALRAQTHQAQSPRAPQAP